MTTKAPPDSPQIARKTAVVEEIRDKLASVETAVLTEYRGLSVSDLAALRAVLREADTEYKVFKNTLARRGVEAAGCEDLLEFLEGPIAIAFVHGDPVVAAKALKQFARDRPALACKGGLLSGRVLGADEIDALADVPPRDELLARLAVGFRSPLVRTAGALGGVPRKVVYAVRALVERRDAAADTPTAPDATGDATDATEATDDATDATDDATDATDDA